MNPLTLRPLTTVPTMLALAGVGVLVMLATAAAAGPAEGQGWLITWQAAGAAAGYMTLVCWASLEVMLRMTSAGHGVAGVFAGMLVRLACAMAVVLMFQKSSLPIVRAGLVNMVMLNYLAGLAVETVIAAKVVSKFQPAKSSTGVAAASNAS